jgi:hypothetical protein
LESFPGSSRGGRRSRSGRLLSFAGGLQGVLSSGWGSRRNRLWNCRCHGLCRFGHC